jgi:hypothetical protein
MPLSLHSITGELIPGMLTQRAGSAPDATAALAAVTRTWQRMAAQLEPVIGVRGVGVLLDRALHLTGKSFPWLAQAIPLGAQADAVTRLQSRFANGNAADVAEAGCALLITFTELLSSLIGEPLTERLLASVWLASPPTSEEDHSHG